MNVSIRRRLAKLENSRNRKQSMGLVLFCEPSNKSHLWLPGCKGRAGVETVGKFIRIPDYGTLEEWEQAAAAQQTELLAVSASRHNAKDAPKQDSEVQKMIRQYKKFQAEVNANPRNFKPK
ncbi:hypothetical protein PQQ87_08955 [Paraburkholderia nemoris]|uniref:hypothetical protein n=1 Tax=Paraburkholderia nemoris TaxID=2793076 RepID=UPI0038B9F800